MGPSVLIEYIHSISVFVSNNIYFISWNIKKLNNPREKDSVYSVFQEKMVGITNLTGDLFNWPRATQTALELVEAAISNLYNVGPKGVTMLIYKNK